MSVGNFTILAFVDPIGIVTTPSGMEIFESQRHGSLCWTPGGLRMEWRIRSPSRRGDILLGAPRILAHFEQPKSPHFGTPISPFRVVNWRPHFSMPIRSPDPKLSCTLRYKSQVLPPTLCAIGVALAGRATRGNDANFGDFGIMTPLDEPVVP